MQLSDMKLEAKAALIAACMGYHCLVRPTILIDYNKAPNGWVVGISEKLTRS